MREIPKSILITVAILITTAILITAAITSNFSNSRLALTRIIFPPSCRPGSPETVGAGGRAFCRDEGYNAAEEGYNASPEPPEKINFRICNETTKQIDFEIETEFSDLVESLDPETCKSYSSMGSFGVITLDWLAEPGFQPRWYDFYEGDYYFRELEDSSGIDLYFKEPQNLEEQRLEPLGADPTGST